MQTGKVVASIETIVNDLKPVTWRQVLYEAVTNALQANATEIKINFIQNSLDLEDTQKYIDSIVNSLPSLLRGSVYASLIFILNYSSRMHSNRGWIGTRQKAYT